MKSIAAVLLGVMLSSVPAAATPLVPVTNDELPKGVTLGQALRSVQVLGEWNLSKGVYIKVIALGGPWKPGCRFQNIDPDDCNQARLYLSATASGSDPADFVLLRGPNGEGWELPKGSNLHVISADEFSLRLLGYESMPKLGSDTLYGIGRMADYLLDIRRHSVTGGHFGLTADITKKNERPNPAQIVPEFKVPHHGTQLR